MIKIHIPVEIVAKGRPRFSSRGGYARTYTPKKTRDFETLVAMYGRQVVTKPLVEPLEVDITVKKKPPKSWSEKKMKAAIEGNVLPSVRPDVDNYAKAILDGLDGVAFADDKQICKLTVSKKYAEEHGAVIRIKEMD